MVPALMAALGVGGSIFSFITPCVSARRRRLHRLRGLIMGIIYAAYFWRRYPERVHATEKIFLEEPKSARLTA
jgi:hypothetical protein